MFKSFWGSQEQQSQRPTQEIPSQSWYPPSVVTSSASSRASPPGSSSFNAHDRTSDSAHSSPYGQLPPAEAAGIIALLKDKSVDELRKLLTEKGAYDAFFHSLDQVKIQNNLRDELRKETVQLARHNLEKEPRILELRNQCRIIRTTELAAAQEKLNDLEKQKDEILKSYAPSAQIQRLHDAMDKVEKESEEFHSELLEKEIELTVFVHKYKKLRMTYHRRALLHLAAKTCASG
ncbi:vacuolar protein-sorting-associated protein 37 homolog 1-like [Aristolochia californica]|uniref:vacuolar protein-sorting-associated protein 37 homolog 1-like n=1 Tax=Aristolochia californica TaxID=171875 RepID=UPI0035DF62D3